MPRSSSEDTEHASLGESIEEVASLPWFCDQAVSGAVGDQECAALAIWVAITKPHLRNICTECIDPLP